MSLSKPAAFYLQTSITLTMLAGAAAPTPLYAVYQAHWHFSPIVLTVVFGIYALAVLATLLVFGALSDYVGRRPVLLATLLLQAIAMGVFMGADGVAGLITARVLQGLATGAAVAAVGAGLMDLDSRKGPLANAIAPVLGTATGSLVSGLLVQYLPAPEQLVYVLLALVFLAQAASLRWMPETVARRPGALAALRPRFLLPERTRRPMWVATPALVAAWALAGFYFSIGPIVVKHLLHSHAPVIGGVAVFILASCATLTALLTRSWLPQRVIAMGTGALTVGVATTLLAMSAQSVPGFFLGLVLAGLGFGGSFQGALRAVLPLADADERAGLLAIVYVISYLAFGLPAVLGGVRLVYGGLIATTFEYGIAVMGLAAFAFVGTLYTSRPVVTEAPCRMTP